MRKITDRIKTPALEQVKIGGYTEKIMEKFFYDRIQSEYAQHVVYKETEDAFRNQLDDIGMWQGEYWGKHMISACEVYRYTKEPELLDFIRESAESLLTFQREDGYIGTYRDSANVFVRDKESTWNPDDPYAVYNWNIWCRKYTLWALLECHDVTEEEKFLVAADRLAVQLISELEEKGIDIADTGTYVMMGLPSCSILKPLLMLYQKTGNNMFLEYSVRIAENWDREDGKMPNLIKNTLSGKGVADWHPDPGSWAKVYEMLSCFEGLLELYRYTGTQKYLEASEKFFEMLLERELNLVYSVGYNDRFGNAADEINVISEPCDAIHFMRLCGELYLLSGNVRYMDMFEKTFFNAFLAGVFPDDKWGARGVRSAGRHFYVTEQVKMKYNHCCVNNMPRAFLTYARCAVVNQGADIVVNFYEDMTADLENARVTVSGTYFTDGKVQILAEFRENPADVFVRIPDWCSKASVTLDGAEYKAFAGYLKVPCQKLKNNIEIQFEMEPKIHVFEKPVPVHSKDDWKRSRFLIENAEASAPETVFLEEPRATITYGPLLLARSKVVGNTEAEMFSDGLDLEKTWSCKAEILASRDVRLKAKLKISGANKTLETTVCDYASAGSEKLPDPLFFSIYF